MNRIMPVFLALAFAMPVQAAERRYTVTDFDRVRVDGPFIVTLSTGRSPSAVAKGDSRAIDRISIDVQGRTLRISADPSAWGGYPGEPAGPVTITLTTHDIRAASVTGSGRLDIDKAEAMRFDIGVSGSGSVMLGSLDADTLNLGLLGSGRIAVGGRTEILRATVKGAGDLDAVSLRAEEAELDVDTAGTVELTVTETVNVIAMGPGDTRVHGSPSCKVKRLGIGRVLCGD